MNRTSSLTILVLFLLSLTASPTFAAKKAAKGCFFVGGHPAAQSEALLKKAIDLYASGGDAALQPLRSEESVIVPPSGAVSKVSCSDGANCQVEFRGKQWWIEKKGLQCD
jgi:hypothetical protein